MSVDTDREFERGLLSRVGYTAYAARLEHKRSILRAQVLTHTKLRKLKRQVKLIEFVLIQDRVSRAKGAQ